jgi:hypothetical protein
MSGLLWVSRRARPCDVSALGDRNGAVDTASLGRGRSTAEDLEGERIWSAAAARRQAYGIRLRLAREKLAGRGNSFAAEVGGGDCGI